MGAAPLVILLVGMVFPVALMILTIVIDAFVVLWLLYGFWHHEGSARLWQAVRQHAHIPHWHWPPARNH